MPLGPILHTIAWNWKDFIPLNRIDIEYKLCNKVKNSNFYVEMHIYTRGVKQQIPKHSQWNHW